MAFFPTVNTWKRLSGPAPWRPFTLYVNRKPIDVLIVGLALARSAWPPFAWPRSGLSFSSAGAGICALVPVIGLVQVGMQSMADRYTYIPLIGIFIIVAWGARGAHRGLAGSKQGHCGGGDFDRLRCGLPGGRLRPGPAARPSTSMPRRPSATISSPTARTGHGLLEGREAGRGATAIRGHPRSSIRSGAPLRRRPGALSVASWGCCWPCGTHRRRHRSNSIQRSRRPSATARTAPSQGLDPGHLAGHRASATGNRP